MKPVAWMFKGITGTYFGQADKLDRPDCVDLFSADQLREVEQQRDDLLAALGKCAAKFRQYEAMHDAKHNHEKAERNAEMAFMCEAAIAKVKP